MKWRIQVENFYRTSLLTAIPNGNVSDTTEQSIAVAKEPVNSSWWIVVDLLDETKRDIIFYHRKVWSTLYYYHYNRTNPWVTHDVWALVQINDVAQLFNRLLNNTSDFWAIKQIGTGLDIEVSGGKIVVWKDVIEVPDTTLSVPDGTTKYIIVDTNNQFVLADEPSGLNVWRVTASWWTITEIVNNLEGWFLIFDGQQIWGAIPVYNDTTKHFNLEPKPTPSVYVTDYNWTTATISHNMSTTDINAFIVSWGDIYIPDVTIVDNNTVTITTSYSITGKLVLYWGLWVSKITDATTEMVEYVQSTPADVWTITHNNGWKLADVSIRDDQNKMLVWDVRVIDASTVEIWFSQAVSWTAYLLFKQ